MSKKLTLKKVRKICVHRICENCPFVIKDKEVLIGDTSICIFRAGDPYQWDLDGLKERIKEDERRQND